MQYNNCREWENNINIISAIVSCSSISAWAIWNRFQLLWGIIIAGSQVLNAIKPHLPQIKNAKNLSDYESELVRLLCDVKRDWYKIENGELTGEEINELIYRYDLKAVEIKDTHTKDIYVKEYPTMQEKAQRKAEEYLIKDLGGVDNA
jgi:hypothetical protein